MANQKQLNKDEMIDFFMTYLKEHRDEFPNIADEIIRGILEKEIKEIEYIEQDGLLVGEWEPDKGKLKIVNGEEAEHRIIHEFIHLLSTSKNDKDGSLKVGLSIFCKEKNIDIGTGVNEGITDLIAEIVSGRKNTGYQVEKNAAYMLFSLIGKDAVFKKFYDNNFLENMNIDTNFKFANFFEEDILSMYKEPVKQQEVKNLINEMSNIVDKITILNQEFKQRK